ncbi:MAG: InlB B-repeat-containing protein [Clostridia bacterium]|nr:InlB B-repeat-containing protein [Clostridia bacterium]
MEEIAGVQKHIVAYDNNGGTGVMSRRLAYETATNEFEAPLDNGFIEWNTQPDRSGTSYAPGAIVNEDLTLYAIWGGTYYLGQEVTINVTKGAQTVAESFYVIEDEGPSATNVTLLAKYNLDKNQSSSKYYQLPNANLDATGCAYTSSDYWSDNFGGEAIILDLNDEATYGNVQSGSAIDRAKKYAEDTLGLTRAAGRLLSYEEVNVLKVGYGDMIRGTANLFGQNAYLSYWLSSVYAKYRERVYYVYGYFQAGATMDANKKMSSTNTGVRPVITVNKSVLQNND